MKLQVLYLHHERKRSCEVCQARKVVDGAVLWEEVITHGEPSGSAVSAREYQK
jgi:hypothetical protein